MLLSKFHDHFSDRDLESVSSEEILSFLVGLNDGCKQLTKHPRYSYLKAFFNFIRNNLEARGTFSMAAFKRGKRKNPFALNSRTSLVNLSNPLPAKDQSKCFRFVDARLDIKNNSD